MNSDILQHENDPMGSAIQDFHHSGKAAALIVKSSMFDDDEIPVADLFRGFDDTFMVPHSRNTTVIREDIEAVPGLKVLASSPEAGVYAVKNEGSTQVFLMGHAEYDRDTLKREYLRDVAAGIDIQVPKNYFPDDDPKRDPVVTWRSCAHLLYANWLNYCVYQTTPYDISTIKHGARTDEQ